MIFADFRVHPARMVFAKAPRFPAGFRALVKRHMFRNPVSFPLLYIRIGRLQSLLVGFEDLAVWEHVLEYFGHVVHKFTLFTRPRPPAGDRNPTSTTRTLVLFKNLEV